jgi:hypothetical protein
MPNSNILWSVPTCNGLSRLQINACCFSFCCCTQILYLCQSSHEWMSQPSRDVIRSSREKPSSDSNISMLKGLSIDKRIVVSWSRPDKTTKQH